MNRSSSKMRKTMTTSLGEKIAKICMARGTAKSFIIFCSNTSKWNLVGGLDRLPSLVSLLLSLSTFSRNEFLSLVVFKQLHLFKIIRWQWCYFVFCSFSMLVPPFALKESMVGFLHWQLVSFTVRSLASNAYPIKNCAKQ